MSNFLVPIVSMGTHIKLYINDEFLFCIAVCVPTQESGNEDDVNIGLSK